MSYQLSILNWLRGPNSEIPPTEDRLALERYRPVIAQRFGLREDNADISRAFDEYVRLPKHFRPIGQTEMVLDHVAPHDRHWRGHAERAGHPYWTRLRTFLLEARGRELSAVTALDDESEAVVNLLGPPQQKHAKRQGLVVGYVQSGKTANMSAVIAKAADSGYKLIVVLAGALDTLRQQTQLRFDQELTGKSDPFKGNWAKLPRVPTFRLGDCVRNFCSYTKANPNNPRDGDIGRQSASEAIFDPNNGPHLFVIKKNAIRIQNVKNFIVDSCNTYLEPAARYPLPALIIDDEADQATINIAARKGSVASTNKAIRELLAVFEHRSYVGYTATPFANVLIDPETRDTELGGDLFPEDFIVTLNKPAGYFGAKELFGLSSNRDAEQEFAGLPLFRPVSPKEVDQSLMLSAYRLLEEQLPSLVGAIQAFLLSSAVRIWRGDGSQDMSMLVHPSSYIQVMENFADPIAKYVKRLKELVAAGKDQKWLQRLGAIYQKDFGPTTAEVARQLDIAAALPTFEDLIPTVRAVIRDLEIKVLHARSRDQLRYFDPDAPKRYIVIGGNKLSRGLTIEGLAVSYFVRRSNAYDTLLQMGRWFGYRKGYVDLTRLYLTERARVDFLELAFVELDIREQFHRYSLHQATPREIPPQIYKSPFLQVTAVAKLGVAETVAADFGGSITQQTAFEFDQPERLLRRQNRILSSLQRLGEFEQVPREITQRRSYVLERLLSTEEVCREFLSHPLSNLRVDLLQSYLQRRAQSCHWLLYIAGKEDQANTRPLSLGSRQMTVTLVNRAVKAAGQQNMKVITSERDPEILDQYCRRKDLDPLKVGAVMLYFINPKKAAIWPMPWHQAPPAAYDEEALDFIIGTAFRIPQLGGGDSRVGIRTSVRRLLSDTQDFVVQPDE